ncbi:hypothetical protein GQ602_005934 [Ophiocordyceps camponoti-floridani]|uniref:Uncharacterized protein n=1 Tax=Ophiocordyceps camponoti-floridani TaxID=2030778 RepID=A0A8H4VBD1_9HYPO|nr:hypothetical protein GQ602_005934 [Ophiocordyceps camponoti-floridani]
MAVPLNLLRARDLVAFPSGDNDTDTVLTGNHFNLTTLQHWNYTLFSNQTLSNGTRCWLTMRPYQPDYLLNNGTFVNATKCWVAIDPIGTRGVVGIALASVYGIALVFTLAVLTKHGRLHLPKETRFYPIGRRWQWYWAAFVCCCALISLLANIDVDRYYIQELPIVLTGFFWFLICQGTLALTWEAVRHWGSWLERQYVDPNPFVYRQDDRRAMVEFWLPLWFYLWVWLNFFLVVPRGWGFVEKQRSVEQTQAVAIPTALGGRFKGAGFCLFIAWLTIVYSLRHSIHHYKPRNRGIVNRVVGLARVVPLRFMLMLPLNLSLIAYQVLISFDWDLSILRFQGMVIPVVFAWGYGPTLLIVFIQVIYGFATPNEDKELIRQRRVRGDDVNRELGIVKRPAWWRRVRGDHIAGTLRDRIQKNVDEVGGERGVGRRVEDDVERHARLEALRSAMNDDSGMELGNVSPRPLVGNNRVPQHVPANGSLLPGFASDRERLPYLLDGGSPPPYSDGSGRRASDPDTEPGTPLEPTQQKVRSMLDV